MTRSQHRSGLPELSGAEEVAGRYLDLLRMIEVVIVKSVSND